MDFSCSHGWQSIYFLTFRCKKINYSATATSKRKLQKHDQFFFICINFRHAPWVLLLTCSSVLTWIMHRWLDFNLFRDTHVCDDDIVFIIRSFITWDMLGVRKSVWHAELMILYVNACDVCCLYLAMTSCLFCLCTAHYVDCWMHANVSIWRGDVLGFSFSLYRQIFLGL